MGFAAVQVFLVLGLLATSCIAQAPGSAPTQPPTTAKTPTPAPPTASPSPSGTSPSQAPNPNTSSPPAPGPNGPAAGPGDAASEQPGSEAPSAAFSVSKTFVAAFALAGTFVAMVLA